MIISKGILDLFIWGIMNHVRLLEREKLRLSCRMESWLLHEVRHVPKLSRNLISAGQLGDEGCVVTFN